MGTRKRKRSVILDTKRFMLGRDSRKVLNVLYSTDELALTLELRRVS